jgi:two-component system NtrC family sensor kinase
VEQRAAAFARFFEAVREGVYIGTLPLNANGGSTTRAANPHLRTMFGYPAMTPESEVAPFAPDRFAETSSRDTFLNRLVHDGAVTDYPLRMRRLDGSPVWLEVTARTEPAGPGEVALEALVRDVSERKRVDDQSRDLYHQLLQAEKMAALGQTISGVAHELNNPLATILSCAERLVETTAGEALDSVKVILGEAERAARIVRNLLTFARKRQSTRSMVDINQIIEQTIALRSYGQRVTGIEVITSLAAGLPQVFADGHQIQQVLLNLVTNAEQAMLAAHGRGTLVVRTWYEAERDAVVIDVADDGPGIAADVRTKIFDPFFTTKEVGKGTGLGLTVAYAIVQEHGGRIRVQTSALAPAGATATGAGASFLIELPANVAHGPAARPRAARGPSIEMLRGARILLVEDERPLAAAVADGLTDAGLEVEHAGDGEEAFARVRQANFDAVICDLKMPRVDGMMLYRAIAAATPTLARRVIFVTGDVAGTDAERFLEESGCRWLAKPFRLADLLLTLRDVLA